MVEWFYVFSREHLFKITMATSGLGLITWGLEYVQSSSCLKAGNEKLVADYWNKENKLGVHLYLLLWQLREGNYLSVEWPTAATLVPVLFNTLSFLWSRYFMNWVLPFKRLQPAVWWRMYGYLERELKGDCPIVHFIIVFKNTMMGRLLKANKFVVLFSWVCFLLFCFFFFNLYICRW